MYVGDIPTDDLFQVTDETFDGKTGSTVLNLTGHTLEIQYRGKLYEFSGPGYPIWPAQADPNKKNFWNSGYTYAADDCSQPDVYQIFIKDTDPDGHVITIATGDTLTVATLPSPA